MTEEVFQVEFILYLSALRSILIDNIGGIEGKEVSRKQDV